MKIDRSNSLARAIADNPWASLQDVLLLSGGMVVALVLALEYDLFRFGDQLTPEERRITVGELLALTLLLAAGIVTFVLRRLTDSRRETAREVARNLRIEELKEQTQRDQVTGLLNRRGLLSVLATAIAEADGNAHQQALLVLGLRGMERAYDLYGRPAGDRLLKVVVGRIHIAARPSDVIARLDGGCELALLAHGIDRAGASSLAQRLIGALEPSIVIEQEPQKISVFIGGTMIGGPGLTPAEVLNAADLAMRSAKEAQSPTLVFYDAPGMPPPD